jgi:DNA protecting protein DprA
LQWCQEQQLSIDELFSLNDSSNKKTELLTHSLPQILTKKQIHYLFDYTDYQKKVYDETILWLNDDSSNEHSPNEHSPNEHSPNEHSPNDNSSLHHVLTFDQLISLNPLIAQMPDIPLLLFTKGNIKLLKNKMLGVVGTRNPSAYGLRHAKHFSQFLSEKNITIISGLAQGIDGSAHEGAIKHQGNTIAVVGTGLDRVYPSIHKELAHNIVKNGGLILSEFVLGTPAISSNFPKRNRLIAGFSSGLLVVEATQRSGSLITARLAMEMNREVFAIPGSIDSPLTKGCHQLIKQGATLVEHVQDIADELQKGFIDIELSSPKPKKPKTGLTKGVQQQKLQQPNILNNQNNSHQQLGSESVQSISISRFPQHAVFDYLLKQQEAISLESICLACHVAVPELSDLLFNWEMEDLLEKTDKGYVVKF